MAMTPKTLLLSIHTDPQLSNMFHFYRIVVTTVVTAGHLVTYGVARGHFSHIFIDEAGQAHEPEAIIPIAGLAEPGRTR